MRVDVKVKFGSQTRVEEGDPVVVTLTQQPQRGRANKQLLEVLSDHYRVPKNTVQLVSGAASRKKVVELLTLK